MTTISNCLKLLMDILTLTENAAQSVVDGGRTLAQNMCTAITIPMAI